MEAVAELALSDRSQIFLFVLACHRLGLRTMIYTDDLIVVCQSADEEVLVNPVVSDIFQAADVAGACPLSLTVPPDALLPAVLAASAPVLAQGLRSLHRNLRSHQRVRRAAECALARLDSIVLVATAPALVLPSLPAAGTQTSPQVQDDS